MYMLKSIVSVALFAVAAIAQSGTIAFTSFPSTGVTAGQPVTITWMGGDSTAPVTITLKKGLSTNLGTVGVLTSSATGGSYTWTPDTTLANGPDYALYITQGTTESNYSGQFGLTGGSTAIATTATATGTTTGTASSAAASSTGASSTGTDSSATSSASSASASSAAASSTLATSSTTRAATSSTSSSASSTGTTVPASGASGLQSPLALLFGVVAAMLYLQ